jgi:DNA helicase-2/ATP-dependent DNA helicase PcrA
LETYGQEFTVELAHYDSIISLIKCQMDAAKNDNVKSKELLRKTNREMWENASHSADDFDSAASLSLFYQPLASGSYAVESSAEKLRLLSLLLESAYFARIDFRGEEKKRHEKIYIGRGTLMDDADRKIQIYDWRAPIASLFYRFETGDAFYDAPAGRISGDIALKRQYEIKKGVFEYFFDADVQIADEFLRKMLSGNSTSKMKTIVETIQKDQDIAIRDMSHDLLMVQGIAGSGKTSIALHRVAYLKYQGLSSRLKSSDIIILSPNTLFEQYISNVLPELGEDEVKSVVFDDLVSSCLQGQSFETRYDQTEGLISCEDSMEKALRKQAIAFKLSGDFARILERYVNSLPTSGLVFTDIEYGGAVVFTGEFLREKVLHMKAELGLAAKLAHLRHFIFEKIHKLRKERMTKLLREAREDPAHPYDWQEYARSLSIEESTRLALKVNEITGLDCASLYKKLLFTDGLLASLSDGITLPANTTDILSYSQGLLTGGHFPNEDALAAAYIQLLTGVNDTYKQIRQVVVDEAQDYYSLHFEILKRLFPNTRYTVLGDINQTIEKQESMTLYEHITDIMQPDSACLMTMDKSFRCTKEILSFSMQILDSDTPFESFNRSGDVPQIIKADNDNALCLKIIEEAAYSESRGYGSIGIICKDALEANALFERLKDKLKVHLVKSGDNLNTTGVFVIPITMSKGLEFDSVLIYGVSESRYHSDDDKKLLYIASTRALHRLTMFYTGDISPLIRKGL